MRPRLDVFVDDEGLFTSKLNPMLTAMAEAFGYAGVLYGSGVSFGVTEHDGATVSLAAGAARGHPGRSPLRHRVG